MYIPPPPLSKITFAASLIALAFAATYTSSTSAFSSLDFRNILLLGGAASAVLLLATLLIRSDLIANAALSLITLASVGTAYIIHTDLYLSGSWAVLVLLCAASAAGLFVAFRIMDETRWSGAALSASALLALGIVVGAHLAGGDDPVRGDVSNIRDISFEQTPNLYFVSFDAAAPRAILDRYLDVETTEFHDLFDASFRSFPNFFTNSVYTGHSLNTLLALDVDIYTSQRTELSEMGRDPDPRMFSGQNPSPLLGILQKNGYETTSIYVDTFFGRRKGPFIDHYVTFERHTLCNLLDAGIRDISFWGYCRLFDGSYEWDNMLTAERITKASANDGPQFVIAYLYSPGHTDNSFRWGDAEQLERFKSQYIENSEEAARYLETIIRHLKENDPSAILLVFGDHGMFLSRALSFEDDREFVLQDNYAVIGGIYPPSACASYFDQASAQGYMTILDAAQTVLRCMSGGESPLIEPRKYTRPAYGTVPWNANAEFEEFLYE